jgi:hypothetical protein
MQAINEFTHTSLRVDSGPMITTIRFAVLLLLISQAPATSSPAGSEADSSEIQSPILAFISDTQAPIVFETLALKERGNEQATRLLFSDLRRLHPTRIFILGDLVSVGSLNRPWEDIDRYVTDLRKDSIPVDAILGNHEMMMFSRYGEKNFMALFPRHVRTGYLRTVDSTAVILLNSNFSYLSRVEDRWQLKWYGAALDSLQADPGIRAIIVCCHHSPFSNSTVVGSSVEVQNAFIPPFLATPKCLLFLSGHAHTFEHFQSNGKDFLVIGGGGGLNQPLYQGKDQRWKDLSPVKPLFHSIAVQRKGGTFHIGVRGLREETSTTVEKLYELEVPFVVVPANDPR